MVDIALILKENTIRNGELNQMYDPYLGIGSLEKRVKLSVSDCPILNGICVPESMTKNILVWELIRLGSVSEFTKIYPMTLEQLVDRFNEIRLDHDFEFWAASCAHIKHKETSKNVPFVLNRAQRKLLRAMESRRLKGLPIRIILLKARQLGGSTLIQIYATWIQNRHKTSWHSCIIGDIEEQARNIRAMYRNVAKNYPEHVGSITLVPFEKSNKNVEILETNCVISIGSMQQPDGLRSSDIKIAHFSEVGLWKETMGKKPEDLIQAIKSTIPLLPYTMVVEESTAKGVGNYFHRSWIRAQDGESGYTAVFIAWHEIERYRLPIENFEVFINSMNEYEWSLWKMGATLEGIHWYRTTLKDELGGDEWRMKSEFPSTAEEAFQSTGHRVFSPTYVANIRATCKEPSIKGEIFGASMIGREALENLSVAKTGNGNLWLWQMPCEELTIENRYCAFADIGGTTERADYSVIRVLDRYWMLYGGKPEIVATWRGHLDQDLFAWKCVQIAKFYNNALLAIESNSLDTEGSEGDHFLTVLDQISEHYDNLYARTSPDAVREGYPARFGFHTNKSTKSMIIDALKAAARDELYIERDYRVPAEMDSYEIKTNGKMGAVDGQKDDLVMTTAGVVWLGLSFMDEPFERKEIKQRNKVHRVKSIADF